MMQNRNAAIAPTGPVEIRASAGSVAVTSAALFDSGDDRSIHTLIERLYESTAVKAVSVDRRTHRVEIQYDPAAMDSRAALRTFSKSLGTADPACPDSLVRQYLDRVPGRIKRVERRISKDANHSAGSLASIESLFVDYDPEADGVQNRAARGSLHEPLSVAGSLPADITKPWFGEVVIGGIRRFLYLTAAGGCLVMSVVGFITPGIPTVPFVLATGYFLARSSPALHERFKRSRFFGQMVSDYEDRGGLRLSTKRNMILLTMGLMVVTGAVAGFNVPLLVVMGVMGSVGIYLVVRIPTVSGDEQPANLVAATA